MPERIISGGQTGVDRAALDTALAHNIPIGGHCPKGRLAEDGRISGHYPLTETDSPGYATRTRLNIQNSDGTLILYTGPIQGGTQLTCTLAQRLQRPLLLIDLNQPRMPHHWLQHIRILNIAGPRESSRPGIYHQACQFLDQALQELPGHPP